MRTKLRPKIAVQPTCAGEEGFWQAAPGFSCEPQSASLLRGHKSGMHPEQSTYVVLCVWGKFQIQNNQPSVVCLGKVTQILQLGKSRPSRGKRLNLELLFCCLFVAVVFFFLPKKPGCSLISGGDVNQERVDSEEEHEVATSQVLEAFKQQKLHLNKIFRIANFSETPQPATLS